MKKQIFSGFLALSLASSYACATFTDINSDKLAQTASVLKSLKIMQGDSENTFSPARNLTRAEFSKLLVTMLGIDDVTAYKNYTIFPDVPSSHWAAGYINAAVRHPELQKKAIIKGYADGTFRPDATISYGEACTMLLLALGYTVDDIGPMWPSDYVARAESLGLKPSESNLQANTIMSRENAAYMLFNALTAKGKEGASKIIDSLTASSDSQGAILISTSKTDSELNKNQAKFYIDGEVVTKNTEDELDESLIGMRGTLYYSKKNTGSVLTMLPDTSSRTESYTVESVQSDKIETKQGITIKPSRDTMVYLNGSVGKYGENWFNLMADDEITLHYDSSGNLALIRTNARKTAENSFIYGTNSATTVPSDYRIIKNGLEVGKEGLKKYDVITIDSGTKTVYASDKKLTGVYSKAEPSFKNPAKITFLGKEFNISEKMASSFAKFSQGDKITLLLDNYGSIAGVYNASEVRAEMIGVFESVDGTNAQVRLINGITIKGNISDREKKLVGKAVSVTQGTADNISVIQYKPTSKKNGQWDIKAGKIGDALVSPNVAVYEQVYDSAPLYLSSVKQLPFDNISSSNIKNTILDSSGNIVGIILGDVSGDAWNYGYGYISSSKDEDGYEYDIKATLKFYDYNNKAESSLTYNLMDKPVEISNNFVGMAKGAEKYEDKQFLDVMPLKRIAQVKLSDFDTDKGVKTSDGYYKIADEVQVYSSSQKKFMTLNQAKADYSEFTLYAERTAEQGGKIRMIVVN